MKKVSYLKEKYYTMLMEQLGHKYNDKFKVVGLYNEMKDYFITLHQGLKRRKNLIRNKFMEDERERKKLDQFVPGNWKTIDRLIPKSELKTEIMDLTANLDGEIRNKKFLNETLVLSLYTESQTYFENNINVFTNGMSLMAMNGLELEGKVHAISA